MAEGSRDKRLRHHTEHCKNMGEHPRADELHFNPSTRHIKAFVYLCIYPSLCENFHTYFKFSFHASHSAPQAYLPTFLHSSNNSFPTHDPIYPCSLPGPLVQQKSPSRSSHKDHPPNCPPQQLASRSAQTLYSRCTKLHFPPLRPKCQESSFS